MLLEEINAACVVPEHKNLELIWDFAADLPMIRTDSKKVKYILENLIHNAIKFTDEGQVTISARRCEDDIKSAGNGQWAMESSYSGLNQIEGPRSFIEFQVADTGIGISCDALPRIFDKFYQADSSATRDFGGMGLGLYIVKKFTDLLGGTIEANSGPGKGSTFTVRMPADL